MRINQARQEMPQVPIPLRQRKVTCDFAPAGYAHAYPRVLRLGKLQDGFC